MGDGNHMQAMYPSLFSSWGKATSIWWFCICFMVVWYMLYGGWYMLYDGLVYAPGCFNICLDMVFSICFDIFFGIWFGICFWYIFLVMLLYVHMYMDVNTAMRYAIKFHYGVWVLFHYDYVVMFLCYHVVMLSWCYDVMWVVLSRMIIVNTVMSCVINPLCSMISCCHDVLFWADLSL